VRRGKNLKPGGVVVISSLSIPKLVERALIRSTPTPTGCSHAISSLRLTKAFWTPTTRSFSCRCNHASNRRRVTDGPSFRTLPPLTPTSDCHALSPPGPSCASNRRPLDEIPPRTFEVSRLRAYRTSRIRWRSAGPPDERRGAYRMAGPFWLQIGAGPTITIFRSGVGHHDLR